MSRHHLYRVGWADFDTLAASSAQVSESNERTADSRPDRVLGAGEQARAAASAGSGDEDAHDCASCWAHR